ncbi:hypothetical protein GCM10010430_02200 [Kitasatospora cystarginea]|uniref:Uncharacterized protein n=1 Tax=Kitasatospora cystarginea TaxID=58350 RepID=A0ABN3DBZ7_9ACTN
MGPADIPPGPASRQAASSGRSRSGAAAPCTASAVGSDRLLAGPSEPSGDRAGKKATRPPSNWSACAAYSTVQPGEPAPSAARVSWRELCGGPGTGSKPASRQASTTRSTSGGLFWRAVR